MPSTCTQPPKKEHVQLYPVVDERISCTCLQNRPRTDCSCDRTLLKASPQYNKVRVPPSPTSRTRVMIGERRDRGAGPPAEEDVVLRDIHRCLGKRRSSSRPGSRGAFGRRGRPERVRGVPQIDRGKGRRLGRVPNTRVVSRRPSTDRLSNGRPRGARRPRSVIRQADAFWRVRWPFAEQTGLAGRARSTSGREAVCRRGPRRVARARDRPGASRPRAHRSRGPRLTRD